MALAPTLRIATLQGRFPIVDPETGIPTKDFIDEINKAFANIATIVNNQGDLLTALTTVEQAVVTVEAAVETVETAVTTVEAAVVSVEAQADAVQAQADAIVIRLDNAGIPP